MKCTMHDIKTLAMCDYAMREQETALKTKIDSCDLHTPYGIATQYDYLVLLRDLAEARDVICGHIRAV